jgi:hypothetical protein
MQGAFLPSKRAAGNTLVEQFVCDLDAVGIRRLKLLQQIGQLGNHAAKPIVLLVVFTVLQMVSSQHLQVESA